MKYFLIAGESSADLYASQLIEELKKNDPCADFTGIGGHKLQQAGMEILEHQSEVAVVGGLEIIEHFGKIRKALQNAVDWIRSNVPEAVLLFDLPDFNFMVIKQIRKWYKGKIIYIISPQVWAWRKKRREFLKKNVDHMIVILPFEKKVYEEVGFQVEYLGHPLVDIVKPQLTADEFKEKFGFRQNCKIVTIFPGSRKKEIEHHHAVLSETILRLKQRQANVDFCIVAANDGLVPVLVSKFEGTRIKIIVGESYDAVNASHVVIAKSGTTTLEVALCGKPAVVFYRLSSLSFFLAKRLIKVPFISLPNLILNEMVFPEFIQNDFNTANLVSACNRFLEDTDLYLHTIEKLGELRKNIGESGFFKRAAFKIGEWVNG